jgi:hypothetical protein
VAVALRQSPPDCFYYHPNVRLKGWRDPNHLMVGETPMRKMKLDIEELAVETFATRVADADVQGTVHGNALTDFCGSLRSGCDTCQLSCTGSCATGYNCQQVC